MNSFEEPFCGFCRNTKSCICSAFVPCGACYIQALAVSTITKDSIIVPFLLSCCLGCIGAAFNRSKIRTHYNIEGSFLADCVLSLCCLCSTTQEYREVEHRENR